MMSMFPRLKILFTVFSLFSLITGDDSSDRTSVDFDQTAGNGEEFVNKIIHGEKIPKSPGVLMFTAPYKLCEGGCKSGEGGVLAMGFPLFIGKKGREMYRTIYPDDFTKIHKNRTNAPFTKRKLTNRPWTTCKVIVITMEPPTETAIPSTTSTRTTTITTTYPTSNTVSPGICWKKIKTVTHTTPSPVEITFDYYDYDKTNPKQENIEIDKVGASTPINRNRKDKSNIKEIYTDFFDYVKRRKVSPTKRIYNEEDDMKNYMEVSDLSSRGHLQQNIFDDGYFDYSE